MNLSLDPTLATDYKSKSQRSRVITETWAANNLYCLNCTQNEIQAHRPGKKVEDYLCPTCDRRTQLKAKRGGHGRKVANSAYEPKMQAIWNNQAPDYAFLGFNPDTWTVTNLFIVPGHYLTPNIIEKRNPLRSTARRSGWVGSNILLDEIPQAGRIHLVQNGTPIAPHYARDQFQKTAFLKDEDPETRTWLSAVMDCVDEIAAQQGDTFQLADVYVFEERLSNLYPDNQHVRAKIRQQLQVLRDEDVIEFLGQGEYRLR